MLYITKIKMKTGCYYSQKLTEIDQVYIDGQGFIRKGLVYDYLKENPKTIKVNRYPYPEVIPALSSSGEKYVRSSPNDYEHDNLLDLPRE